MSQVFPTTDLFLGADVLPPIPVAAPAPTNGQVESDAATPSAGPRTGRDIQRGALRDLITLASDCASTESDIERQYRTGKENSARLFGEKNFEIDQKHTQDQEQANQKHQSRLAELARQYKSERSKIAAADKAARKTIDDERASIEEKLKKKFDHAVWLADSVLEVANGQAGLTFKQKSEAIAVAHEELNGYEVLSANLIQQYGVPLPK